MNWLIVAAGGNGSRAKLGFNKIFAKLNNSPLIYWTIKTFEKSKTVDNIVICAKKNDIKKIKAIIIKYKFEKIKDIVEAGNSRQASTFIVLSALKSIIKNNDLVGIHNAVNPFVTKEEIARVYREAKKYGAALLAIPAKDTVKITRKNSLVENTPIRERCWYAQTPQVSSFANLWKAFVEADNEKFIGTDDTQLLERAGVKVKVVPCSYHNIKITFPEDLVVAEQILKNTGHSGAKR
ncbi:2-C-methyl-D-erythritol 4-phosphate cytidylyltransferase [Candidatus Curtissbacteria bacterium RBG_13_40_7]|uniref:2-C-methyl-D-erythritol 4-phosphate cytidylyltransferase n=1 Tax=Candidatus Curtissbacteria bacterium RBG_13_40_7 TaxID=1797706 RepID=A0A1F5FZ94_9BACT|nr:MAG: 2-C-methyl-D-erythritol 4-phosphate cytidylyltransferase [Candidatus Curtissbacteria bacterium RBG_13_40_7]